MLPWRSWYKNDVPPQAHDWKWHVKNLYKTVESDVIVILVGLYYQIATQVDDVWVEIGTGKYMQYISIKTINNHLGESKVKALFLSVSSHFYKRSCLSVGRSVTQTFEMSNTADSDVLFHSYHLSCLTIFIFIPLFIHTFIHSINQSFITFIHCLFYLGLIAQSRPPFLVSLV